MAMRKEEEEKRKLAERKKPNKAGERGKALALREQLVRETREQIRHEGQKDSLEQLKRAKKREVRTPFPFAATLPRRRFSHPARLCTLYRHQHSLTGSVMARLLHRKVRGRWNSTPRCQRLMKERSLSLTVMSCSSQVVSGEGCSPDGFRIVRRWMRVIFQNRTPSFQTRSWLERT